MEKAPGIELSRVWDTLKAREKLAIVKQIASISCNLVGFLFPCYGALYRTHDVDQSEAKAIDGDFAIGPTVGRTWFDDRRGDIDICGGPCKCPHEHILPCSVLSCTFFSRVLGTNYDGDNCAARNGMFEKVSNLSPRLPTRDIWRAWLLLSKPRGEIIGLARFPQDQSLYHPSSQGPLRRYYLA